METGNIPRLAVMGDNRISMKDSFINYGLMLVGALVVALATKGVSKTREEEKLARLGIGKGRREARHSYTTTISLKHSKIQNEEDTGTGLTRRPHLRRGHVRHQHFGPGNQFVKAIFIEAMFVNSDREFVTLRDHYNISLPVNEVSQ